MKPSYSLKLTQIIRTIHLVALLSCTDKPLLHASGTATVDVIVVGATPGGIAAAVSAARSGASVFLVEEQAHVGGVFAGGLSNIDNNNEAVIGGLFVEFKDRIEEYYIRTYGADSVQVLDCRGGTDFEPHVAEKVFMEMIEEEKLIRLKLSHRLRGVHRNGSRLSSIVVVNLVNEDAVEELKGGVFIDATYEGDLAALSGVPYRVGRESRGEYGEQFAGRVYMNLATKELLPGSTGEADRGIQAYCFRFPLTQVPGNRVPVEKPFDYNRGDYLILLADAKAGNIKKLGDAIQLYRKSPNGKYIANNDHSRPERGGSPHQSLDLPEENWDWPEAGPEQRARIFQRYYVFETGLLPDDM
ncbi:MAG: FAD-dependent oxidoreductase [bacterium]|nr:FAD-dependent oxidoreductase [bacterium]